MSVYWTEDMFPHQVIGGELDGKIVTYRGCHNGNSFNYSKPGLRSFAAMYVVADSMRRLTADEANEIEASRSKESV